MNPANQRASHARALTPAMAALVERMARAARPPLYTLTPQQARVAYEKGANVLEVPQPALDRVEDLRLPARDGYALPARLYAPAAPAAPAQGRQGTQTLPAPQQTPLPWLLYLHGGGFTVGSIASHDTLCRVLAAQAGCAVVSLDYRLAPEHKFPVAVNDAWDAYAYLAQRGAAFGLDPSRIAVGGDSAGGTLAAVTAIAARDAAMPLALQCLFYPGTAPNSHARSHHRLAHAPVLDEALIGWFFHHYLRNDADRQDWRFAPLMADDLEGVAPAWIGLAEIDPMVDDGVAYADRLRAVGVPVDLEIYRGVTHEFIKMGRAIPEARQAQADAARALRKAFKIAEK
ncbi:MAG: alpha/beta hydrolase [Burkholderiaceae bacterium]|jgi:acetyl esterase|nr:alpha/beta hydrolase [Burkholderiaceae bacterium]